MLAYIPVCQFDADMAPKEPTAPPYPSHFDANNLEMVASALAAAPSVCLRAPSGARQIRRASGRNARVARVRPTTPTPRSDSTI